MQQPDLWIYVSSGNSQAKASSAILAQRHVVDAQRYFDRHAYGALPELPSPRPDLGIVVVVPALAEPDLLVTLESLSAAQPPVCGVELIVVVNAPDNALSATRCANAKSLDGATEWAAGLRDPFRCHVLDYRDLAVDDAGVGLARKLGMDAAVAQLARSGAGRGVIASLDADCRVQPGYLTALEAYFREEPAAVGATIYFEHPLDDTAPDMLGAIVDYELHLRCYKQGLQFAGSPYAAHTVGSAFAVRSDIYAQEGGMNRRTAGEDFYFINKLLKRGRVGEINSTAVFPSARISRRVPFGTGAAMYRSNTEAQMTYAPQVYQDLRSFLQELDASIRHGQDLPSRYQPFLDEMRFAVWFEKTSSNVASIESLAAQLNRWLDGFKTMKFINWLTKTRFPRVPVADAANQLLAWRGVTGRDTPRAMLDQFRDRDRNLPL